MEEIAATLFINIWQPLWYLNSTQKVVLDLKRAKEDVFFFEKAGTEDMGGEGGVEN